VTNNYARPAPRARADAPLGAPRCAPIHAYVFFDDADHLPLAVAADPGAWVVHHVPAEYANVYGTFAGVVGVDPNGEAPDAAPSSESA
jgi:hypothetical protein